MNKAPVSRRITLLVLSYHSSALQKLLIPKRIGNVRDFPTLPLHFLQTLKTITTFSNPNVSQSISKAPWTIIYKMAGLCATGSVLGSESARLRRATISGESRLDVTRKRKHSIVLSSSLPLATPRSLLCLSCQGKACFKAPSSIRKSLEKQQTRSLLRTHMKWSQF